MQNLDNIDEATDLFSDWENFFPCDYKVFSSPEPEHNFTLHIMNTSLKDKWTSNGRLGSSCQGVKIMGIASKELHTDYEPKLNEINIAQNSCQNIENISSQTNSELMFSRNDVFENESILLSNSEYCGSQAMTVSSQSSTASQMVVSSQESTTSQEMVVSSQESTTSQEMVVSSQESTTSQEMVVSSQESTTSQPMVVSSQESTTSQPIIASRQESFQNSKTKFSKQENLRHQAVTIKEKKDSSSQVMISSQKNCSKIENSYNKGLNTWENSISDGDTLMELRDILCLQNDNKQSITNNEFFQRKNYCTKCSKLSKNRIQCSQRKNSRSIHEKRITAREADILKRERIIQKREIITARREKLVTIRENELAAREADILKCEKIFKRKLF